MSPIRFMGIVAIVLTMVLPLGLTSAQESSSSCKRCPAQKCAGKECMGEECTLKKCTEQECTGQQCTGQQCSAKKNSSCKTVEFELVGVDFPFGVFTAEEEIEVKKKSKGNAKREIAIEVVCDCDIPFLSNIPYVNRLFKNVGLNEKGAKVGVPFKICCGKTDGCCAKTACTEKTCAGCCSTKACAKKACANKTCGSCVKIPAVKCCPNCPATADIQLAGFVADSDSTEIEADYSNEMIELRIENERLQAELEAAERHFEFMEEMCGLREENAELRARLKYSEKQKSPMPPSVSARHIYAVPPTMIHPHPPHPPIMQRTVTVRNDGPHTTTHHLADGNKLMLLPKASPSTPLKQRKKCGGDCNKTAEVSHLMGQVKQLKKELKEAKQKK